MELIGKISKGTKMDQIYIPKNRVGFSTGQYVVILPLNPREKEGKEKKQFKPYFYNVKNLELIKIRIIEELFNLIEKRINPENIVITGSFLEKGFKFNDLDILLIKEEKIETKNLSIEIENLTGIKSHVILLDNKTLVLGLSSDPLYSLMLSKCISKNRLIFNVKREINYKLLDLHLLKSKILFDNFDILGGNEKYYSTLNMVSIFLFIQGRKLSKEIVNKEIEKMFDVKIEEIKENTINKQGFLKKYKEIYNKSFNLIMEGIK